VAREELCDAARGALARAATRIAEHTTDLTTAREQFVLATRAREDVAGRSVAAAAAATRRARAESERERIRTALVDLERAAAASETLRAAAGAAHDLERVEIARSEELRQQSEELRTAMEALSAGLADSASADRTHGELLARRDEARRQELATTASRTAAAERLGFAEQRRGAAERGVAERRRHVDEADRLTRTAAFVAGPFRDALLDLERRLLGRAHAVFERNFARSFSALVEDPGLMARCSPTFVPYVEIDGEMTPAAALSGGERTALALAFRLALGEVVRSAGRLRLDTIVLDEPTDGFSPEQVVRMGELLRALPWGQVIVVTHEAGLSGIADASVRVRKEGGVSRLEGAGTAPGPTETTARRPRRRAARLDPVAPPAT
jgi:exonuclease SbcC